MGGQLSLHRPPVRRAAAITTREPLTPATSRMQEHPVLRLQQQAGNQAVAQLLAQRKPAAVGSGAVQRKTAAQPELAPIGARPTGSLTDQQWAAAHRAAVAKPSVAAYEPLFRDIALAAGMNSLRPGFVPATVPVSDGKTAQPGLNMTLDTSDDPGHTGWVDDKNKFGVPMTVTKGTASALSVAIVLSPAALAPEKELSLRTARHEMVHAAHKFKVLAALSAWQKIPARRRPDFTEYLRLQSEKKRNRMSALDVALIGKGAQNGVSNTEVLGYVEGFTTDYHRRPATEAGSWLAFFELLGVVETRKVFPWAGADKAVKEEALTRLREYHATLPLAHQRLWKQWLDKRLAANPSEKNGRKDFLTKLTAFVT